MAVVHLGCRHSHSIRFDASHPHPVLYFQVPEKNVELTVYLRWMNSHSISFLHPSRPSWDLGKCLAEFGDASFHRNQKLPVYHDVGELHPNPFSIHMSGVNPLSTFRGTSGNGMKYLVSPTISGIEKSLYAMASVNFTQPPPPLLLGDANPSRPSLGPRQVPRRV